MKAKKVAKIVIGTIFFPITMLWLMSKNRNFCTLLFSVTAIITIIGLLTITVFGCAVEFGYNAEQYFLYSKYAMLLPLILLSWCIIGFSLNNIRDMLR